MPNLRSGECQLAAVDGDFLYCNARSPLGNRVQALSADEGTSFLPGELVPTLAETARGCQGSIVGFPAPPSISPQDDPWLASPGNTPHSPRFDLRVRESLAEGARGFVEGWASRLLLCYPQSRGPENHGLEPGPDGDKTSWTPELPMSSASVRQSSTWLLYSHPAGRRARLHMGIYLSRSPLDPHSWTEPWVIYEGPSGYSDLAFLGPVPGASLVFACLFESGTRASYEDISFCLFSLADVLENVPTGLEISSLRDKPQGHCWPS